MAPFFVNGTNILFTSLAFEQATYAVVVQTAGIIRIHAQISQT